MIIREKSEEYDGSHRLVMYEPDEEGKLSQTSRKSDIDDQIATFYTQRQVEMERLKRQVLDGEISPIALCMTYQQMTAGDLASRVKLSRRKVKKHLTPAGFRDLSVELLLRYCRVFNVTVADLFQFLVIGPGVEVKTEQRDERLFQLVRVAREQPAETEVDHEDD